MGLIDWLTDGIGSSMGSAAGQGETGMGALTPPTPGVPPTPDVPPRR